jgi:outer membrane lipoprotein-sorting protein
MKKTIIIIINLVIFTVGATYAQDLQSILDKHFKAIGQEKVLNVQTQVSTGKVLQMGTEIPFKSITKRPDKAYMEMEIQGAKVVMAFDGEKGWAIQPWTGSAEPVDLPETDLLPMEELSDMDGAIWDYKEKGHQLELIGTEDLEGTQVYHLKMTRKNGNIFHYYLDSEKFIILKMKFKMMSSGFESEIESLMSDFRDVDGYLIPFAQKQIINGQAGTSMIFEEVKFNEDIDDAIFLKPVTAPANE